MRGKWPGTDAEQNLRLVACVLPLACVLLFAAAASGEVSEEPETLSAHLTFVPEGLSLDIRLDTSRREVRFKNEPEYQGGGIVRGAIPLGDNTAEFVGFAWDKRAGLLYVDANRNLDLTDDPDSPYRADEGTDWRTVFKDILLTIEREGIPLEYVLNIRLRDEWYASAEIVSGWQGAVMFGDMEYTATVLDNLDGSLGGGDSFYLTEANGESGELPETLDFATTMSRAVNRGVPGHLAVGDATYAVEAVFEHTGEGTVVRTQFLPLPEPFGELRLQGSHIRKAVFVARDSSTFLVYPAGNVVRAPVGTYGLDSLVIEGGWEMRNPQSIRDLAVRSNQQAVLEAGGPLRETIVAHRNMDRLDLSHEVRGAGNALYTRSFAFALVSPPSFAVYRGDTQVHSGAFEYG